MNIFFKNAFKGAVLLYIANAVTIIVGLFLPIILVRNLSQEAFGAYKLIQSLIVVGTSITSFGLQAIMSRYLPELITKKQNKNAIYLFIVSVFIRASVTIIFFAVLAVYKSIIFNFFNFPEIFLACFIPIAAIVFFVLTKRVLGSVFLHSLMLQYLDCYNIIFYELARLVTFGIVLSSGGGLKALIYSWLIIEICSFLYYIIVAVWKSINLSTDPERAKIREPFEFKRILSYGFFHFMSGNLVIFHNIMVDNFIISKYLTVAMVGLYGLAATISNFAMMFDPGKLLKSVFSTIMISKYTEMPKDEVVYKFYDFLNKSSLFLLLPSIIGLILISDKLILYIYNPDYIKARDVLYVLLPFLTFSALLGPLGHIVNLLEKNYILLSCGISSIYNLVMDIYLVQKFGLEGIAFATGSALLFQYILYYMLLKRHAVKLKIPFKIFFKIIINTVPMIIFIILVRKYIYNFVMLFILIIAAGLIYFTTAFFNKIYTPEERDVINRAIKRKIWVF